MIFVQNFTFSGEIYTASKSFTLPPAVTALTNLTSGIKLGQCFWPPEPETRTKTLTWTWFYNKPQCIVRQWLYILFCKVDQSMRRHLLFLVLWRIPRGTRSVGLTIEFPQYWEKCGTSLNKLYCKLFFLYFFWLPGNLSNFLGTYITLEIESYWKNLHSE